MFDVKYRHLFNDLEDGDAGMLFAFAKINGLSTKSIIISNKDIVAVSKLLERDPHQGYVLKGTQSSMGYDPVEVALNIRKTFSRVKKEALGDKQDAIKKMKRFAREYPNYSEEDIYKAVDYYLENTPAMYIRRANYFIFKRTGRGEELSDLARSIDELQATEEKNTDSNWI